MKKILVKGLTVGMVVAIMASGFAFADTTTEDISKRFQGRNGDRKNIRVEMREMDLEERIAELEAKLENEDLTDEMKERIQGQLDRLEEGMVFQADLEALLENKTDEEKISALEDLIADGELSEQQEKRLDRIVERYTIGEETLEEIRTALEGAEKEDRLEAIEALIDSGDYSNEALEHLENQKDRLVEGQVVREELEAIRADLDGLTGEEKAEKIQELIDTGDLSDVAADRLEKLGKKGPRLDGQTKVRVKDGMGGRRGTTTE